MKGERGSSAARWLVVAALAAAGFSAGFAVAPRHWTRAATPRTTTTLVRPVVRGHVEIAAVPKLASARRPVAAAGTVAATSNGSGTTVPTFRPATRAGATTQGSTGTQPEKKRAATDT